MNIITPLRKFIRTIQVRWSDMDPNKHVRHSAYYDYAGFVRIELFNTVGLTSEVFESLKTGPILFREEMLFKREIRMGDKITIDVELIKATADYSRWSLSNNFFNESGTLVASSIVDGAWIDMEKRKIAVPDLRIQDAFFLIPKSPEFEYARKSA